MLSVREDENAPHISSLLAEKQWLVSSFIFVTLIQKMCRILINKNFSYILSTNILKLLKVCSQGILFIDGGVKMKVKVYLLINI